MKVTALARLDAIGRQCRISTWSGTSSTTQRNSWRQKFSCVRSSTGIEACICHTHESCGVKANALPRP